MDGERQLVDEDELIVSFVIAGIPSWERVKLLNLGKEGKDR